MDNRIAIAKTVAKFVVGRSVAYTLSGALKSVVPVENKLQQLYLTVGTIAVGGVIADKTLDWTDAKFDEVLSVSQAVHNLYQEKTSK